MTTRTRTAAVGAGIATAALAGAWRRQQYLASGRPGPDTGVLTGDGVMLAVDDTGVEREGPTVLLVHGFAGSRHQMQPQRGALEGRYRVVELDQRGHGRSGWSGARRIDMDRLGRDLAEVLEQRTTGPVVVVTHSMGGMALLALVGARPELVGSVVVGAALVSTSAQNGAMTLMPKGPARFMRATRLADVLLFVDWLLAPLSDRLKPFRRRPVRWWLGRRLTADVKRYPDVARRMADLRAEMPRSDTMAFFPGMLRYDGNPGLEALRSVPTLVLAGELDRTIPSSHSLRMADALGPNATVVLVPGAGHMVNVTHADVVNDHLAELLERVSADGA